MKNVNGATAQKKGFLKSIVLALLVCFLTLVVGCSDVPQKSVTVTDIGGSSGQELHKEASSIIEIGGGKTIRGELSPVTDIGGSKSIKNEFTSSTDIGGKSSNGTIHFSERRVSDDIGGKSSTIGKINFSFADIGGRNGLLTGNVHSLLVLDSDIGGKDRDIIRMSTDEIKYDIGGGGKGTTTTLWY
jgi:hypothetical protein